jgi:ferric-dicitrate binding protein FerR (iron transport regulator)
MPFGFAGPMGTIPGSTLSLCCEVNFAAVPNVKPNQVPNAPMIVYPHTSHACIRTSVALLLALSVWLGGTHALALDRAGVVVALIGQGKVLHAGGAQPEALAVGAALYKGDTVSVETASRVRIKFEDGSRIVLGEFSSLTIQEFSYEPEKSRLRALLEVPRGLFRATLDKFGEQSSLTLRTPSAVAAVRGTDWMGDIKADTTGIVVLEGEVAVSGADPKVQGEVILTDGRGTDVKAGESPGPPKKWGTGRVEALINATSLP